MIVKHSSLNNKILFLVHKGINSGYYLTDRTSGIQYYANNLRLHEDDPQYEMYKVHSLAEAQEVAEILRQRRDNGNGINPLPQVDKNDPKAVHKWFYELNKMFGVEISNFAHKLCKMRYTHACKNKGKFGVLSTEFSIRLEKLYQYELVQGIKRCRELKVISPDILTIVNGYQLYRKKGILALLKQYFDDSFFLEYIKKNPKSQFTYDRSTKRVVGNKKAVALESPSGSFKKVKVNGTFGNNVAVGIDGDKIIMGSAGEMEDIFKLDDMLESPKKSGKLSSNGFIYMDAADIYASFGNNGWNSDNLIAGTVTSVNGVTMVDADSNDKPKEIKDEDIPGLMERLRKKADERVNLGYRNVLPTRVIPPYKRKA